MGDAAVLFMLVLFVGSILVLRLIGAWMLRINDVIRDVTAP